MPHSKTNSRAIFYWLLICAFMVMAMTGIGAVTRLTESGLSITEWNVVSGALPPLSNPAWQEEFAKYQATPEFSAKHHWMTIADFKGIYFWEWFHRLWGRLIGLVFALPMVFFWVTGRIAREDRLKYLGLLILGGSQGFMGWFMVQSGLVDRPSVSHFRLAAHLSLALIIYCALLWMAFRSRFSEIRINPPLSSSRPLALITLGCAFVTIIWGAFVAGLDAGMIYNSFPMMGDRLWPPELGNTPFFYDPASVQFTHRILATLTGILTLGLVTRLYSANKPLSLFLGGFVCVQIILGIVTLLSVVMIPIAVAHQIGAIILLSLLLYSVFITRLKYVPD
ncbi:MAG TPA: COX15/CtaA family protein [Alphaproteobacteria bacterium]|nr:COX15/CtaA family protein [Alphaproteobacteria bacterium]